jgi:putative transposase
MWHLDELFVTINGRRQYLWRAVDRDGDVIDILLQPRRDRHAAARFFRKLLKGHGRVRRRIVTDRLGSYGAAHRVVMPSVVDDMTRYANKPVRRFAEDPLCDHRLRHRSRRAS